jgi:hypothetical protein
MGAVAAFLLSKVPTHALMRLHSGDVIGRHRGYSLANIPPRPWPWGMRRALVFLLVLLLPLPALARSRVAGKVVMPTCKRHFRGSCFNPTTQPAEAPRFVVRGRCGFHDTGTVVIKVDTPTCEPTTDTLGAPLYLCEGTVTRRFNGRVHRARWLGGVRGGAYCSMGAGPTRDGPDGLSIYVNAPPGE